MPAMTTPIISREKFSFNRLIFSADSDFSSFAMLKLPCPAPSRRNLGLRVVIPIGAGNVQIPPAPFGEWGAPDSPLSGSY